ncbi:MAG: N-acetylglucosamine-6-phosphate deacetylase [Alphaproteobacteria bacterium]|nr:N-acetylglucosamine-6-phosphate deacetylase [Alphaproteobacteria bacterium]
MIALDAPILFDGRARLGRRFIVVDGARVTAVLTTPPPSIDVEPLPPDTVLAPGFVDLQVNGGGGVLFNDVPDPSGLATIARAHAQRGTTTVLPTLVSAPAAVRDRALGAVREARAQELPGIGGVHVEGPFLAPARRGIHPASALTAPSEADLAGLCAPLPAPRLITVAPDVVAPAAIAALNEAGWRVFLGHSDATCEQARAALDAGAVGFTHLFNAMSPLSARGPGLVGAAFDDRAAFAAIIVDGHHVHPVAIRLAWRVLGPSRLFLVSDAMPSVGGDGGGFLLGGRPIHLSDDRLTDEHGTLAGAHLWMALAVRNAVRLVGISPDDALRMATLTPAEAMGLHDRGRIAPGARADFVLLDRDLGVHAVWQGGVRI